MTKIEQAEQAIAAIEQKTTDTRDVIAGYRRELVSLPPTDPDSIARRDALQKAIRVLEQTLPDPTLCDRAGVNLELEQAKETLARVIRERVALSENIARIESIAIQEPQIRELKSAFKTIADVGSATGMYPPGFDPLEYHVLASVAVWLRNVATDIVALPNWKARLAEYGDLPDGYAPERDNRPDGWINTPEPDEMTQTLIRLSQ